MNEQENKQPTLWQVAQSVLSALIGVQSSNNYKRDFQHGKPSQYIVLGLVGVALFIGAIIVVVRLVISLALA